MHSRPTRAFSFLSSPPQPPCCSCSSLNSGAWWVESLQVPPLPFSFYASLSFFPFCPSLSSWACWPAAERVRPAARARPWAGSHKHTNMSSLRMLSLAPVELQKHSVKVIWTHPSPNLPPASRAALKKINLFNWFRECNWINQNVI